MPKAAETPRRSTAQKQLPQNLPRCTLAGCKRCHSSRQHLSCHPSPRCWHRCCWVQRWEAQRCQAVCCCLPLEVQLRSRSGRFPSALPPACAHPPDARAPRKGTRTAQIPCAAVRAGATVPKPPWLSPLCSQARTPDDSSIGLLQKPPHCLCLQDALHNSPAAAPNWQQIQLEHRLEVNHQGRLRPPLAPRKRRVCRGGQDSHHAAHCHSHQQVAVCA
mmetsp:Transcript_74849/g.136746  ORF Transcript_74849/g.136746 Transcript_74849/m.136746 type:complete len:218 (-) Transcript_74849:421-1074(-)